ncbi:hypothetical protein GQ42DRAFT_173318 [Ramicandelaber brevisporus]|nr:hypothetical protein GQ42DRAFT_173318 [Ramicandelaber brevisporus]
MLCIKAVAVTALALTQIVSSGQVLVKIGPGYAFTPSLVTIHEGDSINFEYDPASPHPHNVVQSKSAQESCVPADNGWQSPVFTSSSSPLTFTQTFPKASNLTFHCSLGIHCREGMVGTVVVLPNLNNTGGGAGAGAGSSSAINGTWEKPEPAPLPKQPTKKPKSMAVTTATAAVLDSAMLVLIGMATVEAARYIF